jgi:hypothetical protein
MVTEDMLYQGLASSMHFCKQHDTTLQRKEKQPKKYMRGRIVCGAEQVG